MYNMTPLNFHWTIPLMYCGESDIACDFCCGEACLFAVYFCAAGGQAKDIVKEPFAAFLQGRGNLSAVFIYACEFENCWDG
jgi:hypothetical protein